MDPIVSVIVPCYNQAQYLPETLDSLLSQTYSNWECIIVNDGSPDNTEEIAKTFCTKDNRIKYVFQNNGGLSSARNKGIKESTGEYILPLDADDKISERYMELAMQKFKNAPETELVYCRAQLFGNETGEWKLPSYNYELLLIENMIFCSAIFRRSDYNKTDGYDEQMSMGFEDWNFWINLLHPNSIVYQIPEICFYYRVKDISMLKKITPEIQMDLKSQLYLRNKAIYDAFIPELIWNNPIIRIQQNRIRTLEHDIRAIHSSKAYQLGRIFLNLFSFLKRK
jgi:glycosyltransferase involved in cell wall biosynthesis